MEEKYIVKYGRGFYLKFEAIYHFKIIVEPYLLNCNLASYGNLNSVMVLKNNFERLNQYSKQKSKCRSIQFDKFLSK